MRSRPIALAPNVPASSSARADERLATIAISAPRESRLRAACSLTLPRTDEQDAAPSQVAEHLVGERSRRRGDRRRGLADRRLHSCAPASVERLAEEPAQHRPRCTRFERQPHLAEDLALARHERIEARSDTEEVQRRLVLGW